MRKLVFLFGLLISVNSLSAMVRAGIDVPIDGYYYNNYPYYYDGYYDYWYGPGWYWGTYYSNEDAYWGWRGRNRHWPQHWHNRGHWDGHRGYGGHHH